MASNIVWNGITYPIPTQGDPAPWGSALSAFIVAIPAGALQKTGGSFTLTTEVDFGATAGLKSLYLKSRGTNPAATGIVRLANAESVVWRNAANSADLALTVNASNALQFNGANILSAGAASIVNADINASAAIAFSKMAALTASRALQSSAGGVLEVSAVTATELGYVSGVTSALQTQLNAKAADSAVVHLAGSETITGAKTFQDQMLKLQEAGSTDVVTINVAALAASRAYTVPDAGGSASFVMTEGAQTLNGNKTLSALIATLAANMVAGGFKLTGLGAGAAAGESARYEQLKVLQVVLGTSTTNTSTTSATFVNTNLSASITPVSTSNKVLILAFSNAQSGGAGQSFQMTLANDITNLLDANGQADTQETNRTAASLGYLDSPATTSAITYRVRVKQAGGGTGTWGATGTQVMILAEVNGI